MIKWIKKKLKERRENYSIEIICSHCNERKMHTFKIGINVTEQKATCGYCGLTSKVIKAECRGGWDNFYIN